MEHLKVLKPEEKAAVDKFKEYGITIALSFGSKAYWHEVVHNSDLYSDGLIQTSLLTYADKKEKFNRLDLVEDEPADRTEFKVRSADSLISVTTDEMVYYLSGIKRVRKWFRDQKEAQRLKKLIEDIDKKSQTKSERLSAERTAALKAYNKLVGIPDEEPEAEPAPVKKEEEVNKA